MTSKYNNGWTPERRAKQAEAIKRWKPWAKSTGPKSEAGKNASRYNSYKHGCRSAGALKLRAAMAKQSRWLNEVVRAARQKARLDFIGKIAVFEKNATNELMDRRVSLRGAAPLLSSRAKRSEAEGSGFLREIPPLRCASVGMTGKDLDFSRQKSPDSCMVRRDE